jgi:hypothetical protein
MLRHGVRPASYPHVPVLASHPLWAAFDSAVERVVLQVSACLIVIAITSLFQLNSSQLFAAPTFFSEQLRTFEVALSRT